MLSRIRENRRNIFSIGLVSLFNDLASEMIYPLLPLFLATVLGAGPLALGVIEGIAEATASGVSLFSGLAADRLRVRKPIMGLGYIFSNLVRPVIGLAKIWPTVFILRFADRAGKGIRGAPRDALLADSAPEHRRGFAFGFQRAMDHTGAIIGPLLAALLLSAFDLNIRTVFLLSAIPGAIAILIIIVVVKELKPTANGEQALKIKLTGFPRPFYIYVVTVFMFTLGNSSDAFLLLRAQNSGLAIAMIPLLWSLLHVSKTIFSFLGGYLSDTIGRKGTIVAGWIIYSLVYLGFAAIPEPYWAWLLFAVYGIYFGLTEGPQKAFVSDFISSESRSSAYGLFNLALSFATLFASLIFGAIWSIFSASVAFGMGSAIALIASLALAVFVSENKKAGHTPRS